MAARGDPSGPPGAAAFDAFVREFEDMVYAVAVRLLANEADAEDVAQTVFLRAYERFGDLQGQPAAPGWLKTVTTNLCLNHLERYRARWRFFSELGEVGDPPFDVASTANGRRGSSSPCANCRRTSACRSCCSTSSTRATTTSPGCSACRWGR